MELLPAIDILDGQAVRLAKGDYEKVTVYNSDPLDQAKQFEQAGAKWIHIVDLDGARSGCPQNIALIESIIGNTSLEIEVGGGIRTLDTLARFADIGVSRIVLGTSLVSDPDFAQQAIESYGDLLAAGIDAKGGEVAVSGWQKDSGVPAENLVRKMAQIGYAHLVYTDISRDGMQTGIDENTYVYMAKVFGHPVIASGGVANIDDIVRLGKVASVIEGVIAGRALYEGSLSVEMGVEACEEANRKIRN